MPLETVNTYIQYGSSHILGLSIEHPKAASRILTFQTFLSNQELWPRSFSKLEAERASVSQPMAPQSRGLNSHTLCSPSTLAGTTRGFIHD
jgi:hypothetical protein